MLSLNFNLVRKSSLYKIDWQVLLYIFLIFYLDMYDLALFAGYAVYLSPFLLPELPLFHALLIFTIIFVVTQFAKIGGFLLSQLSTVSDTKWQLYPLLVVWLCCLWLTCFPTYNNIGIAAFFFFAGFRVLQGFALGVETGMLLRFANAGKLLRGYTYPIYVFILLASEVGMFVSIFINRLLISNGVTVITYEVLWRLQFIFQLILVTLCLIIKIRKHVFYNEHEFTRVNFISLIKNHWKYILLRSMIVFYNSLLIVVVVVRLPNVLGLVFHWSHSAINSSVLLLTVCGFVGANLVLLLTKFINPLRLMMILYLVSIFANILCWHLGLDDHHKLKFMLWLCLMGFFYGCFLRLTPTVVFNVSDFEPENRLIGRYMSYLSSFTILLSIAIISLDYSHFIRKSVHDSTPVIVMIIGALVGMVSLAFYAKYYKNKLYDR